MQQYATKCAAFLEKKIKQSGQYIPNTNGYMLRIFFIFQIQLYVSNKIFGGMTWIWIFDIKKRKLVMKPLKN